MATIDDVARLANVSKGTVSNVFSRKRPISKEVRDRVLKAAKKLNYTPNHIARSLATKKTMTIGLKIPYYKNLSLSSFHTNLISGVILEAAKENYRVLIDTIVQDDLGLPYLTRDPIDGVIILDPQEDDERISLLHELETPFVVIGKPKNKDIVEDIPYVDNNNEEIAYEVCKSLINKGHTRILFLNAPEKMTVSQDRKRGFIRALQENGLPARDQDNYCKPDRLQDPAEFGYQLTLRIFSDEACDYTAVIADTDRVALGILRALKELDKRVPEDVSLVAMSDDLVFSQEIEPQLTTVDLSASTLGSQAVKLLFENMENKNRRVIHRIIIPAKIKERQSVRARD